MRRTYKKSILSLLLGLALLLTACGEAQPPVSTLVAEESQPLISTPDPEAAQRSYRYVDSMDTIIELTAYGSAREEALDAAEAEVLRLNDLLSIGLEDSEVSRLNREGGGKLSADTACLVQRALEIYDSTGGAFEPTIYPLMVLWGFTGGEHHVPTEEELAAVMEKVGADRVAFDAATGELTLDEGQAIDLGGIAKGYTSARIMDIYREHGLTSGLVSLGGNVQCLGAKPDGSAWRIGVRNPDTEAGGIVAVVAVTDKAVISSGGYERFFVDEESGITYEHIMDPQTGTPVRNELAQVTIVTPDGTLGDGLSTALYIMGLEAASDYWRAHRTEFDAVFVTRDGQIYITEGLKDCASAIEGGAPLQLIR